MEMEQMPAEEGADQGMGEITSLAKQVGDGLAKLSEALNSSQAATDADREQMAMVLNGFIDLVEKKLSGAPGQDVQEEAPAVDAAISADGGIKGVPMGPQGRM